MPSRKPAAQLVRIQRIYRKIYVLRGQKVMIDADLAELYDVPTRVLNQAVRRNIDRFPADFMFQLNEEEADVLRSQTVILENGRGRYSKYAPLAFTEHGVAMLCTVLNSERAVKMSIFVIRAFMELRRMLENNRTLARKVERLEADHKDHAFMLAAVVRDIETLAENVRKEFKKLQEPRKRKPRFGFLVEASRS